MEIPNFCETYRILADTFKKWINQFDEDILEVIAREDSEIKGIRLKGIDRIEKI